MVLEEMITADAFVITAVIKSTPQLHRSPKARGRPEQPRSCWGGGRRPAGTGPSRAGGRCLGGVRSLCLPLREPEEHGPPSSPFLPRPGTSWPRQHFPAGSLTHSPAPGAEAAGTALCCSPRRMQFSRSVPLLTWVPLPGCVSFPLLETPCVP